MVSLFGPEAYTIMGKTCDMADAHRTALTEGYQQDVFAEEAGCSECCIQAN